ncbi:HpcH/HpaI aldolase/citrate lyase family protein [bacterium]|nr:HpcH/HpaI aldolase/citrate lyase family protein [bacterium]
MSKQKASAGRRGPDVRSDMFIELTLTDSGGVTLDIQSKVKTLYGDSIEQLIRKGLAHFGLEHVNVIIEDAGALPFVQMARLEAAVRRLELDTPVEPWLPNAFDTSPEPSSRQRPRRSRLYLPGNEPKFMINAAIHKPDGLILDLEDSVAPAEKDAARILVRNALIHLDFMGAEKMVRVNQGDRGLVDLEFIVPYGVDLILLPKMETADQVAEFDTRIHELRNEVGVDHDIWLMPIVESAKGAWNAFPIAAAAETVVALAIGLEDYTADIGVQRTNEGKESIWARHQLVNGARAANVTPIDTVFSDVNDMDALLESVVEAKALGFEGKGCIHPRQIPIVHQGFAPTDDEVEKAKRIVLAFEEAERQGLGVVSLGSKMIDPPVVKRALRTVDAAIQAGLLTADWREQG